MHFEMSRFQRVRLLAPVVVTVMLGCGDAEPRQETFPVEGRLLVNGRPAAGARIALHPLASAGPGRALTPRATADGEGQFQITTHRTGDGAPPGEYAVTVRWPDPQAVARDPLGDSEAPDLLRGQFAAAPATKLRVAVPEKSIKLASVDLGSSEVKSSQRYQMRVEPN